MKKVLIVDDAAPIRDGLAIALEKKGITAFKAGTGVQAVKHYKEDKPDCVFLDIKLPDLNGMNVCQQIKEIDPSAKIYFITGQSNDLFRKKAEDVGAAGYLVKPVNLSDLLKIIEAL